MEEIRLLGPIELRAHGVAQGLGSLKERCLLAILAMECGTPVSTDSLAARIWGNDRPPQARTTLTSYLSRLKRTLRKVTGEPVPLSSGPGGYILTLDRERVDLHRFRRLRRQAQVIAASGDDLRAVELFLEAEGLWQGKPLAGLPGDWMQSIRESLEEERHNVRLKRIELQLRLGRHGDVVGELHRLAASQPLDEAVIALLMTALYRCDRQADALAVFRRTTSRLRAGLGSEPGRRLRELHQRILRCEEDPGPAPRGRLYEAAPSHLPPDVPDFTGREEELRLVTNPASDGSGSSVTVITGMAGVGKSALAVRAAHLLSARYPDGRLYVNLCGHDPERPVMSGGGAMAELLRLLGLPPPEIPIELAQRRAVWRREMAGRRAIVILDDATSVEQVRQVAADAPSCRVLVTSRRRLHGLPGAHYLALDVLPVEDARRMVTRIVGDGVGAEIVETIVQRCGRLPLVLRLTAARAASAADRRTTADAFIAQVSLPERTGARTAFALTYRGLTDHQRLVFRLLGLQPCPDIAEPAVAALSALPESAVRSAMAALLDHHLVEESHRGRFRMHDLIREFARERTLAEDSSRDRGRALARLLRHYLVSADAADRALFSHRRRLPVQAEQVPLPMGGQEARTWMDEEWQNGLLIAEHAIAHERKRDGSLLVHVLSGFLGTQGHHQRAAQAQTVALHAAREVEDPLMIGQLLFDLSVTRFRTGHHAESLDLCTQALSMRRALGDRRAEAEALDQMGHVLWNMARNRESLAHYQEAQVIFRSLGDTYGEAIAQGHAGVPLGNLGRYEEAIDHFERALEAHRQAGDRRSEAMNLNNIGEVQLKRGYHRDALRCYQESSAIFEEIRGIQYGAILKNNIGNVHQYKGDYAEALNCYREALEVFRAIGDRKNTADALNSIGATYLLMGQPTQAVVHHEQAEKVAQEIDDPYQKTRALSGIGGTHAAAGRYSAALDHYRLAAVTARGISNPYEEAKAHEGIARAMLHLRGPSTARIHWRQALDIFQELGVPEATSVALRLQDLAEPPPEPAWAPQ